MRSRRANGERAKGGRSKGRSRPDRLALALKRRLIERYAETATGRIAAEGALSALGVLLRKHPGVVLQMAAAGLLGAGRRSAEEVAAWRDDRQEDRREDRAQRPPKEAGRDDGRDADRGGRRNKRGRRLSKADRRRLLAAVRDGRPAAPA